MNTKTVHSVCVIGADDELNAHLSALFQKQARQLDAHWQTADQASAELLLIDPDSVYGHMDWLRAQSSGRPAIACTRNPEAFATTPHLRKPIATDAFVALLNLTGASLDARTRVAAPAPAAPAVAAAASPQPPVASEEAPPAEAPDPQLLDLLGSDSPLHEKTCLIAPGLPQIFIDPRARQWHADSSLKALAGWCSRTLAPTDLHAMSDAEFASATAPLPGQPYARLVWFAHLVRGAGQLAPALDSDGRFKLARWPQSEREFPKHFRIATVMLKEAVSIAEITAQSGASAADVADFINAYYALGFVEHDAPDVAVEEGRRRGLFARVRKNSAN